MLKFFMTNNPRKSNENLETREALSSVGESQEQNSKPKQIGRPKKKRCLSNHSSVPEILRRNSDDVGALEISSYSECRDVDVESECLSVRSSNVHDKETDSDDIGSVKKQQSPSFSPPPTIELNDPNLNSSGYPNPGLYKRGIFSKCDKENCELCTLLTETKRLQFVCTSRFCSCIHWHEFELCNRTYYDHDSKQYKEKV